METENRTRKIQMPFRATEAERDAIFERMKLTGITTFNTYALKMLLNGHYIRLDLSDLQKIHQEISFIGKNINQIVKHVHERDRLCQQDVDDLKNQLENIWQLLKSSLSNLLSLNR